MLIFDEPTSTSSRPKHDHQLGRQGLLILILINWQFHSNVYESRCSNHATLAAFELHSAFLYQLKAYSVISQRVLNFFFKNLNFVYLLFSSEKHLPAVFKSFQCEIITNFKSIIVDKILFNTVDYGAMKHNIIIHNTENVKLE